MTARVIGTRRNALINKRRRGFLASALPWLRRFGVLAAVAVVCLWLAAWVYFTGGHSLSAWANDETMRVTSGMGFTVQNILVEGRQYSDSAAIKQAIGEDKGAPLFSFDPAAAQAKLEKLDWVKSADVERRLPDTIYVRLQERAPLALWQKDKTLSLVDEDGKIIHESNMAPFSGLMIVMGEGAPAAAPELFTALKAEPDLLNHVASAMRVDGRRWDIILKENITIKLPGEGINEALHRLAVSESKDKLFEKDVTEIDARQPDRFIMETRGGGSGKAI